jgi:hypothetical protein
MWNNDHRPPASHSSNRRGNKHTITCAQAPANPPSPHHSPVLLQLSDARPQPLLHLQNKPRLTKERNVICGLAELMCVNRQNKQAWAQAAHRDAVCQRLPLILGQVARQHPQPALQLALGGGAPLVKGLQGRRVAVVGVRVGGSACKAGWLKRTQTQRETSHTWTPIHAHTVNTGCEQTRPRKLSCRAAARAPSALPSRAQSHGGRCPTAAA